MKKFKIVLPKPPSVNNMHGIAVQDGRKYLKKKVIDWYQEAGEKIIEQLGRRETIEGRVCVIIWLYTTENDMDNVRKCLYDLLKLPTVHHVYGMGLITDDDMIYEDHGYKRDVGRREEEKVEVEISAIK